MSDLHPVRDTRPVATARSPGVPPRNVEEALAALQASRAVLRHELLPAPLFGPEANRGPSLGWARSWRRWRRLGARWPVAAAARDALRGWWHKQPWRASGELVAEGFYQHAVPVLRRHPLASLGVAAGAGALLVSLRPWRWPLVGAQLHATPRRLRSWAVQQLMSAPVQAALTTMLWMVVQRQNAEPPDDHAAPSPTGEDVGPN